MSLITLDGQPVAVGHIYMTRGNRYIRINSIEDVSGSHRYRCAINYSEPGNDKMSFSGHMNYQTNGFYYKDNTNEWDIMHPLNTKAELTTVESITSAFKFLNLREKELRA